MTFRCISVCLVILSLPLGSCNRAENDALPVIQYTQASIEELREEASAYSKVARDAMDAGSYDEARTSFKVSIATWERIALRAEKGVFDDALYASSISSLGELEFNAGNYRTASEAYNRALDLSLKLSSQNPAETTFKQVVGWRYRSLGELEQATKNYEAAYNYYVKYKEATLSNPGHDFYEHDLADVYLKLGNVSYLQNDFGSARQFYQNCIRVKEKANIDSFSSNAIADTNYTVEQCKNMFANVNGKVEGSSTP